MSRKSEATLGCLPVILVLLFNLSIGGWSVSYILNWFGKDIPMLADVVIGLFVAEISVPIAVVGWILKLCGVF